MDGKKNSNILLIVFIIMLAIVIVVMGYYLYKTQNDKKLAEDKVNTLNGQVTSLDNTVTSLQNTIDSISSQLGNVSNTITNSSTNSSSTTNTNTTTTTTTSKSQEEIIKDLYLQKIKENNESNEEKLLDYRVDKVTIYTGSERDEAAQNFNNVSSSDIFAVVTYSVKPKDVNNTLWIAGNGEANEEWITNKVSCVYAVKENGSYVIKSDGTGW